MTIPRKQQISLEHTHHYHCMSRCVRRAHLCGKDKLTGQNFEHRRGWIEGRLAQLASVFAIDLLSHAIMHNHYHVVLRVSPECAASWSDEEVAARWGRLFSVSDDASKNEELLPVWRRRLTSISWFMRCVNEPVARRANREDGCTGRFWEGRFQLQALLSFTAVIKCMTYVDLNPVRSGLAMTPEESMYTSLRARIDGRGRHLLPFSDGPPTHVEPIAMSYRDYLELVDWTGRIIRHDKRGRIPEEYPPVFERLEVRQEQWADEVRQYRSRYYRAVGPLSALREYCEHLGQKWLKGVGRQARRQSGRRSSAEGNASPKPI